MPKTKRNIEQGQLQQQQQQQQQQQIKYDELIVLE
jgi:hypothetical protein